MPHPPFPEKATGEWLRETFRVEEPSRRSDRVPMVVAFDRESGEEVGRWIEGRRIPSQLLDRYINEVPGARQWWDHIRLHADARRVSLH